VEEVESLKKDMFEIKFKIENEFRRTKKSLEEEYSRKAHSTMKEDSNRAVEECRNLSGKLNVERDRVMEKMKMQKDMESALSSAKVGHSITESGSRLQAGEMELLER